MQTQNSESDFILAKMFMPMLSVQGKNITAIKGQFHSTQFDLEGELGMDKVGKQSSFQFLINQPHNKVNGILEKHRAHFELSNMPVLHCQRVRNIY